MTAILRAALLTGLCIAPDFAASEAAIGAFADEAQAAAFVSADGDGDRQLDANEFVALIDAMADSGRKNAVMVRRMNAYGMAFAKLDADSDGVLTVSELGAGKQLARQYADPQ